jgi:hypothetical protein
MDSLNRQDVNIETHSTLQLFVISGAQTRSYYFATAGLNFGGLVWLPQLRKTGEIRSSITRAANRATLDLQNVDNSLGNEFLFLQQYIFAAEARVGRYWKDIERGTEFHKVLLTGPVVGIDIGEQSVRLTVVADPYSGVSVGPNRRVTRLCQWKFKGPECGFVGAPSVCNFLLNDSGGCEGRWGTPTKFARFGGFPFLDNNAKFKII